jgi:hypothetical protein
VAAILTRAWTKDISQSSPTAYVADVVPDHRGFLLRRLLPIAGEMAVVIPLVEVLVERGAFVPTAAWGLTRTFQCRGVVPASATAPERLAT